MKRANLLFSALTLFLGMTLGCMITLTYIQQADLERCGGHLANQYRLSTASNSKIVDREIKAVVSLSEFERDGGLERLGCVCGEEARLLKEEIRRVRTSATTGAEQQHSAPATTRTSSEQQVSTASSKTAASYIPQLKANPQKCSTAGSSAPHQSLLVAIFTSSDRINRSSVAYDTWGLDVSEVVMFIGNDTAVSPNGLPLVTLGDVSDRVQAEKPRKLFRALSYLHQHYSERYQWFMLVSGEVYVHGREMEKFLNSFNSSSKHYIGHSASGRAKDSQRLKLLSHEQYCMGGPGVVLSQAALTALYPHLDKCLEAVERHNMDSSQPLWYNEDVELGRCVSRNIGVQCSASIDKAKNLFYEDYSRESHNPATLWSSSVYRTALTIHPVVTSDHMHTLHHYYKMLDYQAVMNQALAVRTTINELCSQLSPSLVPPHPAPCKAMLSNVEVAESICPAGVIDTESQQNFYPRHRYHIESWKYFDPQFLYTDQMDFPSYKLRVYRRYHHELQKVLLEVVNAVNRDFPVRKLKIKRFTNGYVRHDHLYGNEYIIDGVFEELGNPGKLIEKRVHLRQMLASNYVEQEAKLDATETVHFIVPVSNVGPRVTEFMDMYEKLSLETHENTHLVMVVYSDDDYNRVQDSVSRFQQTYPSAKFTIVRATGSFSRAKAMDIGIAKLDNNDLAFFCDVDMLIQREFLTRCRRNAIQGKLVYYPEFFKLYNMDYVYFNTEKPKVTEIKRKNGHWAYYSFGMACIYKSDYRSVGGFDTGITGWGDEDVELYEKILRKKINVFRAPDTALTHRWHPKTCSKSQSTAKQYKHCLSSQGENLADRIELAQYILLQQEDQSKESRIFL